MLRRFGFALMGMLVACSVLADPSRSEGQTPATRGAPPSDPAKDGPARRPSRLEEVAADVAAAAGRYRATLEKMLTIYERDLERRSELAELRQDLYERGVLSKREFEDAQRGVAEARMNAEDTRRAMAEADRMVTEARVAEALAGLAPIDRGVYEETPGLVRYNGPKAWSLVEDTPRLQQYFAARFGRPLPISAFGQTGLHDRMGFDHRNALDVAVRPDSPEGRALMEHLRAAGIPFIAAWGPVPGSASGAHLHVGQPSPRLMGRR